MNAIQKQIDSKGPAKLARTFLCSTVLSLVASAGLAGAASADENLNVVTTIKPLHSLVANIMAGTGEPTLLLDGNASPHDASLKPSQAQSIQDADVIFWFGEDLESFMAKPLEANSGGATAVSLLETPNLDLLENREHGEDHDDHAEKGDDDHDHKHDEHDHGKKDDHEGHDHSKKDDDDHEGHDHAKKDEHDHEGHNHDGEKDDDHAGHDHGEFDAHVWLDPARAKILASQIADTLSKASPGHSDAYSKNLAELQTRLDALMAETETALEPIKGKPFMVFHDAYQYFEKRFSLNHAGSVTINPENKPSAARLRELRETLKKENVTCLFSEPQFNPAILKTIAEGSGANIVSLDPLGAEIPAGPDHYSATIKSMAASFQQCLSQ